MEVRTAVNIVSFYTHIDSEFGLASLRQWNSSIRIDCRRQKWHPKGPASLVAETLVQTVNATSGCVDNKQKKIIDDSFMFYSSMRWGVCLHSEYRQRNIQFDQMIVQLKIFFCQYSIAYEIQLSHHFQFRFIEIILRCLKRQGGQWKCYFVSYWRKQRKMTDRWGSGKISRRRWNQIVYPIEGFDAAHNFGEYETENGQS